MNFHGSVEQAMAMLDKEPGQRFSLMMQHGSMSVEYYAPVKTDPQTPHRQDEIYVIASGTGTFMRNEEKVFFRQGDVLFVPAGMPHRFEDFSDDFATWVIFYGPDGGEQP